MVKCAEAVKKRILEAMPIKLKFSNEWSPIVYGEK
jgi:hypothetical protein